MQPPNTIGWIFFAILFGLMVWWYGIQVRHFFRLHASKHWPVANGDIQNAGVRRVAGPKASFAYGSDFSYSYTISGDNHLGFFAVICGKERAQELQDTLKGSIDIRYNPKDPKFSYLVDLYDPRFGGIAATQNPEWLKGGSQLRFPRLGSFLMLLFMLGLFFLPSGTAQRVDAFGLFPSFAPQTISPDWCKALPRPEYKALERVLPNDPWFEVYKVAPGVFAIYEPHQAEEVISYLIVGTKQALLFDTGMGIANIHKVVTQLTSRPVVVLNSHTHNDHVGGNSLFTFVYGMDTDFTRQNAKGSRDDAQSELGPGMICGNLPKGFDPKTYATKPWHVSLFVKNGFKINLGGRTMEIIATPGHTPDAICLIDRANGLLFTGDTYYPAPIWLFRPETNLDAYVASVKWLADLAPQVKLVLGAHNVPVADPSILPRLVTAIEAVRAGGVTGKPLEGGKALYTTDGISFLLAAPPAEVK
jgi:glyoxylase-like metal-dependent hydrolase (beta-lactamase superfamily II)